MSVSFARAAAAECTVSGAALNRPMLAALVGLFPAAIQGGATATTESAPLSSMVELKHNGVTECSGVLIAPRKVLTAAHCALFKGASSLTLSFHRKDGSSPIERKVARYANSPDFNALGWPHPSDLTIVDLEEDAPEGSVVMPILSQRNLPKAGASVLAAGFGFDELKKFGSLKSAPQKWLATTKDDRAHYEDATPGGTATINDKDSGGGLFWKDGKGKWFLVAIHQDVGKRDPGTTFDATGVIPGRPVNEAFLKAHGIELR